MATAPTITKLGSGSSKSSGTSLAVTASVTLTAGDYIVAALALDPASGAVSFSLTSVFTAAIGSWTVLFDVASGSGTSGVRGVMAYAKVTGAGTISQVTCTHPTVTARAAEIFRVQGADGTSPINGSTSSGATLTPGSSGLGGVTALGFLNDETTTGASCSVSLLTGGAFVTVSFDTTTTGTTGGGAASNISVANAIISTSTNTPSGTDTYSITWTGTTGTIVQFMVGFQASTTPVAAIPQFLNRQAAVSRSANY